ncbi:MAG: PH domain-containing protein [Deltaproteobacteria bacterium]
MQVILAFAVLGLLLIGGGWLLRPMAPARLRGVRSGAVVVLRPPRWRNTILAAMAVGPTLLVLVVAMTAARQKGMGPTGVAVVAMTLAAGLAVSAYFLLAERKMQVRVDERGVVRVDPFRQKGIAWGEVETIAYNGVSRWFYLTGPGGVRLWVPENMAGIGDFAEEAMARLRPEVLSADPVTREAIEQLVAETRAEDEADGKAKA